jgi:hypothetical protein
MSFEILQELDKMEDLFPKFNMPVNTERNNHISFRRSDDIVDYISMHVTDLILIRGG